MSEAQKYLFIGGPVDGKRIAVGRTPFGLPSIIHVKHLERFANGVKYTKPEDFYLSVHEYSKQEIETPTSTFTIYLHKSIPEGGALAFILENYKSNS